MIQEKRIYSEFGLIVKNLAGGFVEYRSFDRRGGLTTLSDIRLVRLWRWRANLTDQNRFLYLEASTFSPERQPA